MPDDRYAGLGPKGLCARSGFAFRLSDMTRERGGAIVAKRFADQPHPQDFPARPRTERPPRYISPEPADTFLAAGDVTPDDL